MRTFPSKKLLDATIKLLQNLLVLLQVLDYLSEVFSNFLLFFIERNTGLLENVDRFPQRLELDIDQVLSGNCFNPDETNVRTGNLITKMNRDLLVKIRFKLISIMCCVEWKNECTGKSQSLQTEVFCNRNLLRCEYKKYYRQ